MINSMNKQNCGYILLQGIFLISVLFFALFVSSILFMFNISITSANLLLAVLCSVAVTFYFSGGSVKKTSITTIVGLLILAACVFLCMHVYDWSYDGNTYRKARTGLLKYGWNPIYETFFEYAKVVNLSGIDKIELSRIWHDTSPKASEIIAANFYAITNNIESGKCYTLVSVLALFFISYSFLTKTGVLKGCQSICCAFFCVMNPVVVTHCTTNYNDGFLYLIFLLCFVSMIYLSFYDKGEYSLLSWYFIFISINVGFNIKLSMPLFLGIFCITIFCYGLYLKTKILGIAKAVLYYRNHFCFFVISILSGILITGSTHYISNFLHYGNPVGDSATGGIADEITNQLPIVYRDMSNIERFFCSLFSTTNGSKSIENVEWKLPFTFSSGEIIAAQGYDTRTAGWGILFGGIFLISIAIILYYFFVNKKDVISQLKNLTILLLITFSVSLCFVPGLSWARYNLFVFLVPVAALIYIFADMNNGNIKVIGMAGFSGAIIALLCINMVPNITKDLQLIKAYESTYKQIEQFKCITEYNDVIVRQESGFYGRFFTLYDMDIINWTYGDLDPEGCTGSLFDKWKLYYDIKSGISMTDNLYDFLGYVSKAQNSVILLAVKDEASNALTEEVIKTMQALGLEFNLVNHYRWSYLAVIDSGNVLYENILDSKLEYKTEIAGNTIEMQSAGYETGNIASIKINDVEYALNKRGINIVVYDKQADCVVDSVRLDTYKDNSFSR